jgi:hypothetical protein
MGTIIPRKLTDAVRKAVADASPYHNDKIFLLECEAEAAIAVVLEYLRGEAPNVTETAGGE